MQYTNEQQEQALSIAFKKCGLNNHTVYFEKKSDMQTWADKLMGFFFRKGMPVRKSYMYCETLDMTFFFTLEGRAMYAYSGYADERDSGKNLIEAFNKADEVRKAMVEAIADMGKEVE